MGDSNERSEHNEHILETVSKADSFRVGGTHSEQCIHLGGDNESLV